MKYLFLFPFLLLSSCVIYDSSLIPVREILSDTTWRGVGGTPYSVSFGRDGLFATFTFIVGGRAVVIDATYQHETDLGFETSALYRLDPNPHFERFYYPFYPSGRFLYGSKSGSRYANFSSDRPELVAEFYY